MKLRVGSGLPNIQQKDIKNFEILLPKIEEQTAIAEILATADRELQLQKEKLAQLQTQKKGLMQVLLTGKKRLIN
jgi:type I restriction enzyme S subunit